ncbi:uncharacterized protein LOC129987861 isoform X2 [Argiope bruennichi]|uniref:uncharacterized protein LOC129987861 isoform X2 n=1 Tax=Argiope bruennichi TaxID=94029 RepID=UPI0024954AE3|nr:uncharacterized protein LOC129987861 isoform X2 [Argiope bruennichi]
MERGFFRRDRMEKLSTERKSESMSRSHSQELLDSSSASSVSVFADHSEGQNRNFQKTGEYSPRASMDEALKSEAAFIQYLSSIPPSEHHRSADSMTTRTRSPAAPPTVSKVGLDHLDNLCKLMEQLSELRDTNSKLQKRVQYLEDLKTLHDMHKEICEAGAYASEDVPKPGLYPLKKSATESNCPRKESGYSRSPSKYLSRRSRQQQPESQRRGRSKSVGHEDLNEDSKSRRLFPKWSRVKEAFGWESERKNSIKAKSESGSSLTNRRRSDESSRLTYRHPSSHTWYQNYPSIHSSMEDIHEEFEGRWKKMSVSSEKFSDHLDIPHEALRRQKSTPSPGSEKIPSSRDTDLKPKSFTIERDSYRSQDFSKFEKEDGKRGKSPWGRVKTIIERHRDSIKRRSLRHEPSATDLASAFSKISEDSVDFKDDPDELESTSKPSGAPTISRRKANKPGFLALEPEMDQEYPRTPNSSPVLQRKSKWTRMTKALKGKREDEKDSLSTPTSPNNQNDGHFTFNAIEELSPSSYGEEREISRVGSDSHVHQLALSVPPTDLMLQLQRNLSEDFHRKIQEWDRIRACGNTSCSPQWERKPSDTWKSRKKSERQEDKTVKPKIKDLTWLEKELQKVEKEKQRLSKERLKYEQRAMRLEKLRETVLGTTNSKREVLVKTSAGEFRFEGISDAFTKKLYEWETKKGVGMEYSTIALLNSSKQMSQGSSGTMQRMLSKSESSIADIGLNSSNSLQSTKISDAAEGDKQNHLSRADSEPDLSTLAAAFGGSLAVSASVQDCVEVEVASPDGHKDSDDELDKERKGSETYYSLLEENVLLLERLKEKEEICRRLEKDLEILDEKMEEMNIHHSEETQRYREKLWELHQQGASPREVLCCRRTMEQLRQRIEALERWTRKLKSERETVEVNFRHHSKEQENMTLDLLERMRELQAVGSSATEAESRPFSRMDADTIERLQDLSAQLAKQTQELQETLGRKTLQIRQLKWELLHRDLSTVKLETERHNHSAQKKRSKYAHWRSRSSEEPSSAFPQKTDAIDRTAASPDAYCISSSVEEFQATDLAHTVQQLSKEVQKLTCATSNSSLSKCWPEEQLYTSVTISPKDVETCRNHKKGPIKLASKRITVRRNSADNSSLLSTDDSRFKGERSSSHSDDSSDEYYSRICYSSGLKANITNNSEAERLLMSYGENPPRTQRKKKLQKVSKLNSSLGRRRANTFHTNRDLQKPTIGENIPQKCHSFRVPRENYNDESAIIKTPYFRRKLLTRNFPVCAESDNTSNIKIFRESLLFGSETDKVDFRIDDNNMIREVASDSKIPLTTKVKKYSDPSNEKSNRKLPVRSMSDKTRNETAAEKENLQKRRSKKRLKPPNLNIAVKDNVTKLDAAEIFSQDDSLQSNTTKEIASQNVSTFNQKEHASSEKKFETLQSEIPSITIQFPKRKHRKPLIIEDGATDEQSVTIVVPKKRSLSSECDSSISESSPREEPKIQHSDKTNNSTYLSTAKDSLSPSDKDSLLLSSNTKNNTSSIGSIQLMKLVSLDNFDNPFDQNKIFTLKNYKQNESQARKRKAQDGDISDKNSPTEEMVDIINAGQQQAFREESHPLAKSSTTGIEHINSESSPISTNYIKSPSAPQLDWRKACAKKISRTGAPNVRTLIERYNQKVIESQSGKSPSSSNVSSPITLRKISTPVNSSCSKQYVAHFSSTPSTPTASPICTSLAFKSGNFTKSPQSSPSSDVRSEALKKAREYFIASPQLSIQNSPETKRTGETSQKSPESAWAASEREAFALQKKRSDEDRLSHSSMDSMNLVMLRAGESCRESRLPKKLADAQKIEMVERPNLKASKSLSSSSLFKAVLHSDFKVPTNLLKLKRSKRKKDMSTVTELCRQSLLLTSETAPNILAPTAHKSCPSSPELKSKTTKPNWLQRNIFRHRQ